jgi:hypothetical protein
MCTLSSQVLAQWWIEAKQEYERIAKLGIKPAQWKVEQIEHSGCNAYRKKEQDTELLLLLPGSEITAGRFDFVTDGSIQRCADVGIDITRGTWVGSFVSALDI